LTSSLPSSQFSNITLSAWAVNTTESFKQILVFVILSVLAADIYTDGFLFTVIVIVSSDEQFSPSLPITVYVCVSVNACLTGSFSPTPITPFSSNHWYADAPDTVISGMLFSQITKFPLNSNFGLDSF